MLFDLRGRGRRRTVKVVYITLAFLMGGGLVLFGIGGGGEPAAWSTRSPAPPAATPAPSASTRREQRRGREGADEPAGRGGLGRARPRPRAERRRRRQLRPQHGDLHRLGQGQAPQAADAWEKYLALDPQEPRRPRRVPDGAGLRPTGLNRPKDAARRRRSSPRRARRPRPTRTLAIYAYQAGRHPQGRPRAQQGARARAQDRENTLKSLARPGQAAGGRPADPAAAGLGHADHGHAQEEGEVAGAASLGYHWATAPL